MNVVMGAGYYIGTTHPENMDDLSEEEIAAEIISDIENGVGDTSIRAGLIGEIGCSYPWLPNEKKSLRAAGSSTAGHRCAADGASGQRSTLAG